MALGALRLGDDDVDLDGEMCDLLITQLGCEHGYELEPEALSVSCCQAVEAEDPVEEELGEE